MEQLKRITNCIKLDLDHNALNNIYKYWKQNSFLSNSGPRLHFNKGKIGRFHEEMNTSDIDLCNEVFGPFLKDMGYY